MNQTTSNKGIAGEDAGWPRTRLRALALAALAGIGIYLCYRLAEPCIPSLGICPVPAQGSCDITSLYTAKFGVPAPGAKVFVSVHQMVNGYTDVPRRFSAIVPASV